MKKVFIASKVRHRQKWLELKEKGFNIFTTWIEEYELTNKSHENYINEIKECDLFILYIEKEDILRDAFVEYGIALAFEKTIKIIVYNTSPLKTKELLGSCYRKSKFVEVIEIDDFRKIENLFNF